MSEPLGIALELMQKRRALAARMSPLARKLAYPDLYRAEVEMRRPVLPPRPCIPRRKSNEWSSPMRVTKQEKAAAVWKETQALIVIVAKHWEVPASMIYDECRKAIYARPRQASMGMMRDVMGLSLPVIGVTLSRDHTSCLWGLESHQKHYATNRDYARRYDAAEAEVRAMLGPKTELKEAA